MTPGTTRDPPNLLAAFPESRWVFRERGLRSRGNEERPPTNGGLFTPHALRPWLCDAIAELGLNLVSKSTGGLGRFASVGSLVVISGFRGNLGLFAGVSIEAVRSYYRNQ